MRLWRKPRVRRDPTTGTWTAMCPPWWRGPLLRRFDTHPEALAYAHERAIRQRRGGTRADYALVAR